MNFTAPLECRHISAGYSLPILKNVDLQLNSGELTILIGPNGCGKSTLLKALSNRLALSCGSVLLNSKRIKEWPTKQLAQQLGVLPQHPLAPEELTVKELVSLGRFPYQGLLSGNKKDAYCIEDAMNLAQVSEFANSPIDQLSGGQRQRCWIAMVLAQETDVLLLDEPTSYLDLKVQVELLQLLQQLAKNKQYAIGIVMHELNLAAAFADKLVMMKEGQVQAQGCVQHVFTEANLSRVFDLEAQVVTDAHSGKPFCIPNIKSHSAELALVGS